MRKAYLELARSSGVSDFEPAAKWYWIGALTFVVLIGAIFGLVGSIYAILGFNKFKDVLSFCRPPPSRQISKLIKLSICRYVASEPQSVEGEETLTEIEIQILQGLERLGGSYQQRNLWKYIGIDSKTGLPILGRLEKRGLIKKERIGGERRGVYIVRLTEKAYKVLSELREKTEEASRFDVGKLSEELQLLLSIPCTVCPYAERCGFGFVDPLHCELITRWSMSLIHERKD